MRGRFSPAAENDLAAIHDHFASDDPAAALRVVEALLRAASKLEVFPFLGRLGRVEGTRELVVPRLPFVVIDTLPDTEHVDVETIVHTRRQWPPETAADL